MNGKLNLQKTPADGSIEIVASAFVAARKARLHLERFPGALPQDRGTAYAIQAAQIKKRPERVVGWKVAMTAASFREVFGEERLSGPVFESRFFDARGSGAVADWSVFKGGFAAVEAEFVAVIAHDVPAFGRKPTQQEAAGLISALHIGMELAGSPLATLHDLGPFAVVADCGNNDGVILGPEIPGWRTHANEDLKASMSINGEIAGNGSAASIMGGPLEAVAFLVHHLETRGLGLKAGDIVSTGATTGIHMVRPGDAVLADFGIGGQIRIHII